MFTPETFEIHAIRIVFGRYNKPIHIYPFGDIHWNSESCDKKKFLAWCAVVKQDPLAFFVGMGDYLDSLSFNERKCFIASALHDSSFERIEKAFREDTEDFIKQIKFMRGKCIGIIGGNHYYKFASGITTDEMVCQALNCKFLGVNAIVVLRLWHDIHHTHQIKIVLHHGRGGGRTCGSSINKLQEMLSSYDGVDIVLQGHDHNRNVDYVNRLGITEARNGKPKLYEKKILLARTGSFLRGYEPGKTSYVVGKALPPADLGGIKIELTPRREYKTTGSKRFDNRWVEIKAVL